MDNTDYRERIQALLEKGTNQLANGAEYYDGYCLLSGRTTKDGTVHARIDYNEQGIESLTRAIEKAQLEESIGRVVVNIIGSIIDATP